MPVQPVVHVGAGQDPGALALEQLAAAAPGAVREAPDELSAVRKVDGPSAVNAAKLVPFAGIPSV